MVGEMKPAELFWISTGPELGRLQPSTIAAVPGYRDDDRGFLPVLKPYQAIRLRTEGNEIFPNTTANKTRIAPGDDKTFRYKNTTIGVNPCRLQLAIQLLFLSGLNIFVSLLCCYNLKAIYSSTFEVLLVEIELLCQLIVHLSMGTAYILQ